MNSINVQMSIHIFRLLTGHNLCDCIRSISLPKHLVEGASSFVECLLAIRLILKLDGLILNNNLILEPESELMVGSQRLLNDLLDVSIFNIIIISCFSGLLLIRPHAVEPELVELLGI